MLKFENEIQVDVIDLEVIKKTKHYWESKTFVFENDHEETLVATRGSAFKNNFTFNMMKLKSSIEITFEDNIIKTSLLVDPVGHFITKTEKKYWPLELKAFEQYILYNRQMEDEFKQYYKEFYKSTFKILVYIVIGTIFAVLFSL
ncbi:MAG: hypothetical protein ACOCV1_04555 [Bacillota bacterium]